MCVKRDLPGGRAAVFLFPLLGEDIILITPVNGFCGCQGCQGQDQVRLCSSGVGGKCVGSVRKLSARAQASSFPSNKGLPCRCFSILHVQLLGGLLSKGVKGKVSRTKAQLSLPFIQ